MNGFYLFLKELQQIGKNKKIFIPLIVILFIPLIYGGMFLWSFKDPYEKMSELPVAVINHDLGADFDGEELHLGRDLADNLKDNDAFDFQIVSEKEAMEGLDDLDYYMVVEIPKDFSKNATTLMDDSPKKMEINYLPNDSYNFLASQIGESALKEIQRTIAEEVSTIYAETVFSKMEEMADGFQSASDGATQLNDGAEQLKDGMQELKDNVGLLVEKSLELHEGINSVGDGVKELASGATEISDGFHQFDEAGNQLLDASKQLENGAGSLANGIKEADDGLNEAKENIPKLVDGTDRFAVGLQQLQKELPDQLASELSEQLVGNEGGLITGLNQLQSSIESGLSNQLAPELADQLGKGTAEEVAHIIVESNQKQMEALASQLEPLIGKEQTAKIIQQMTANAPNETALVQQLEAKLQPAFSSGISTGINQTIQSIDTGFNTLKSGLKAQLNADVLEGQIQAAVNPTFDLMISKLEEIQNGQKALQSGIEQLAEGMVALHTGSDQLYQGQQKYTANMDIFSQKLHEASEKSGEFISGVNQLQSGMVQLSDGSGQFANGIEQLNEGVGQLNDGTQELQQGTEELSTKLNEAKEETSDIHPDDETYEMMANPVELNVNHIHPVPNYGTGFAPYFISLGLFVGALIMTIIYPLVDSAGIPKNGFSWFISKFSVMALVGIFQALLIGIVVLYGIDIEVKNVPLFFLFTIITSLTFMSIIQFLATMMGNPGRFIAVIMLILQLTSSAGTFPLEVVPKAIQWFNPFLPMTYSVFGFKAVISSGDYTFMWENAKVLGIFIVGSIIISLTYFVWKYNRVYRKKEQEESYEMAM
ncbi:YhgE/Pip domain-containing protein [Fervidibacillus halotolerans]|uniref:YhgE/Pip domain-containing protein n=1 Tax=Fervidibacillus halotolerans TaxID=2980027 RepID=A0A9E8LYE4_9BACI|nr:YhgE/Pip domain-containing protein [Fervidibacillus halotolerans]WAA12038.1 YhgE/Pip domain-containing protein [Fervidibacillus halotolerans]